MNTQQIKELAELRIQEKAIKVRIEELAPLVLKDILDAGFDKVPTPVGNFNIKKRKVWTYSNAAVLAEAALDELKTGEQASGIATFAEVDQLEFRQNKAVKE